jgi:hypothetical protein
MRRLLVPVAHEKLEHFDRIKTSDISVSAAHRFPFKGPLREAMRSWGIREPRFPADARSKERNRIFNK